jgi:hypothetical protein
MPVYSMAGWYADGDDDLDIAVANMLSAQVSVFYNRGNGTFDPAMQLSVGFEIVALLPGYLHDPVCDDYCVLIVLDAARTVPGARPAAT